MLFDERDELSHGLGSLVLDELDDGLSEGCVVLRVVGQSMCSLCVVLGLLV